VMVADGDCVEACTRATGYFAPNYQELRERFKRARMS
jgi:hypothetical protein